MKYLAVMANWNRSQAQYASFQKNILEGKLDAVNQFISNNSEAVSARISRLGRTALHFAIFTGHENIVTSLVNNMSEENLEIKDYLGYTVLGCCAIVGNIQMARCIIQKNRTLLGIGNGHGPNSLLPVVIAIRHNSSAIDMVRYLYDETPEEDLNSERGINGVLFINGCLSAKYFGENLRLDHTFVCYFYLRNLNNNSISINCFCLRFIRSGFAFVQSSPCSVRYFLGFGGVIPYGGISLLI